MESILRDALLTRGYRIAVRPWELNIIGIRHNTSIPNTFSDSINVLFTDNTGKLVAFSWRATTDPGTFWLRNPSNSQGTAILKPGQYLNSHALGMHRGKYLALVQIRPVTVVRDFNRDGRADYNSGREQTGLFGINIHRALANGTTKYIDNFSAGCQVFSNADDFSTLLQLAERHKALYGNVFGYTLLSGLPDGSLPLFDSSGQSILKKN